MLSPIEVTEQFNEATVSFRKIIANNINVDIDSACFETSSSYMFLEDVTESEINQIIELGFRLANLQKKITRLLVECQQTAPIL